MSLFCADAEQGTVSSSYHQYKLSRKDSTSSIPSVSPIIVQNGFIIGPISFIRSQKKKVLEEVNKNNFHVLIYLMSPSHSIHHSVKHFDNVAFDKDLLQSYRLSSHNIHNLIRPMCCKSSQHTIIAYFSRLGRIDVSYNIPPSTLNYFSSETHNYRGGIHLLTPF